MGSQFPLSMRILLQQVLPCISWI